MLLPCFKRLVLLFLTNCLLLTSASAVESTISREPTPVNLLKFSSLTTSDGLAQSYVFSIAQDKQGFIWLATEDGLDRYDGKSFVHYRHNATDENSLADNFVRKVYIDKKNTLWIATENGLSKYNRQLDNFDNFTHISNNKNTLQDDKIWDIYQDSANNIWVSTSQGLHIYNAINKHFTRIKIKGYEHLLVEVKTIFQDKQKNYWMGTYDSGIFIVNENLTYAISLADKNKWDINIPAKGLYDVKIIEGEYWLATDNGVFIVSDNYKIKKHLSIKNKTSELLSNKIKAIEQTDDGHVWLGGMNGLNSVSLLDYSIEKFTHNSHSSSLSENWINDIYKDTSGKIWLGTYGGGLNVYNPLAKIFQHTFNQISQDNSSTDKISIVSLVEINDLILLSTEQGNIFNYDKNLITPTEIPNINSGFSQFIQKIENNSNIDTNIESNIWLRTGNNRLYDYDVKLNKTIEIPEWFTHAEHPVTNLLIEINNNIWFINKSGILIAFDTQLKSFTQHLIKDHTFTALGVDNTGNSTDDKTLWLTSKTNKLFKFNLNKAQFIEFVTNEDHNYKLTKIIKTSNHWLWLGTFSQGVTLINKANKTVMRFDENNQLNNNFTADILIDENENAWLSTNKGISVITPSSGKVKNFSVDHSLLDDNEFLAFSSLLASDNTMFFGGSNGFYRFNPDEALQITQVLLPPIFTNIFIANKKVNVGKDDLTTNTFTIPLQVNFLDTLTLQYNQFPLGVEFITPNSTLPNQLKYKYRLLGAREEWIEADPNYLRATYTNLSQGEYTFEVQVYDLYRPKIVNSNTIKIRVMPPWWLSQPAIFIYVLISLTFLMYIYQQIRHKRKYNLQIQQSEERLKLSLWGSGDEMWDWNITTGKIFRSNIWGILEFPQDGTRNKADKKTNLHQHDMPRVTKALADHFEGQTDHFEVTYRVKDINDNWIWVLDRGKVVEKDAENKATRMTGTLKDISKIKKTEERLKLFAKCIENISDAVVIYNKEFITVDINKAFQRITGKTKDQMLGKPLTFHRYPEKFCKNIKSHLINNGSWHGEIESTRANGEYYLTDINIDVIRDENHEISHFVGVFSDVTKRKETEKELRTLANSDTLTGLPNRAYFQANQSKLVENKTPHALLVFDLDNFKKINDSLGHQVGDALLCRVAQRIVKLSSRQNTVYRLGGDEFGIIIDNTNDINTITSLTKKILKAIAQPLKLKNQEIVLYGSIGIVLYPEDGATPHELLKNADTAMYHAKGLGGNKYQFFNDSMKKKALKLLQIESLIRIGLKEDLFSVYYQPKIEIATGKIAGMEALVRFETANKSLISPVVFIPIAEQTGQIIDIGEVVLRKSCFATKQWVDAGLFNGRVAVNLSAVQFTQPNLVDIIALILVESKLPAKYLELEITEGTVMGSPQQAIATMLKIREMGIHLSLDDFGTGYSSLAYLKKFPLNTLKIDKAFVDDIEHSERGRNMVATIVTIAHNLDMHVVAEGVETNQQLDFLSGLKCEQLQGYLYSKPLTESDFTKYLLAHQITDKSTAFSKI